jgi:hypothetical protein
MYVFVKDENILSNISFKLCELESIVANESLTISRMYVAMTYLHTPFLELLIEQLEQVNKY